MTTPSGENTSLTSIHIKCLAYGFLMNFVMVLYIKLITFKFPLNFLTIAFMIIAMAGFPFGLVSSRRGASWLVDKSGAILACILVFICTAVVNQNVTTHFLLGSVYYPYPMPPRAYIYVACLGLSILSSPAVFYLFGALFGAAFRESDNPHKSHGMMFFGMAAGAVLGYYSVLWAGLYIPLTIGIACACAMIPKRKLAVAGVAACAAVIAFAATNKNNVFFVWRIDEYKHLSEHWTPYYRVDFISFDKGHCLGAVHNTLMIWYTCDQVDMLPAEMRRILREVSAGRKNILLAGRTDGLYASMITASNKHVEKFVSVAEDPVVARMMTGKYARYNGYVFKRPEMQVHSGDIRQFLNADAEAGHKYDLVFLNGIGIALMMLPHGIMKQEDYLTAKENYEVIFNKLLKRNGVFVIDWGSSMEDEIYPMMANVPDGVYARGFHFWLGEFPLSGLPLFYVIASRDKKALDHIASELSEMPSIMEIKLDPAKREAARFSDDKPFHLKPLAPGLIMVMMPVFFMLAVTTSHFAYRRPWSIPTSLGYNAFYYIFSFTILVAAFSSHLFYFKPSAAQARFGGLALKLAPAMAVGFIFVYIIREVILFARRVTSQRAPAFIFLWAAGVFAGLVETCVYSRISRLMPGGPAPGAMFMGIAWCVGFGAALIVFSSMKKTSFAALIACSAVIAAGLPYIVKGLHPAPISFVFAVVMSFAACAPWAAALHKVHPAARPRALAMFTLGSLAGLYIFQVLVVIFGYYVSAWLTGAVSLACAVFLAALSAVYPLGDDILTAESE